MASAKEAQVPYASSSMEGSRRGERAPGLAYKVLPEGERVGVGKHRKLFGVAAAVATTGEDASGNALPDGEHVGVGLLEEPAVKSVGTVSERARRRAGPAFSREQASSAALALALAGLLRPRPPRELRADRFCSGTCWGYPAPRLERTR